MLDLQVVLHELLKVDFDTTPDDRVGKVRRHTDPVTGVGDVLCQAGHVVLRRCVLHVRQHLSTKPDQVVAPTQEVTCGTMRGGIGVGNGKVTTAQ